LAQAGDRAAGRLIEDLGRLVGVAVAQLASLCNPAVVALGGPITVVGDLLLEPVRAELHRRAMPAAVRAVKIVAARNEPRSEVYGALTLALSTLT
jgi:predicted NBD/HSP70 family sugar kinase